MTKVDVILKKDIVGIGSEGDIKKVALGYARNYLFPYAYAVPKNIINLRKRESQLEAILQRKKQKIEASKSLSDRLSNLFILFQVNASSNGKLFGSIGINEIHKKLKEKGFDISKEQIKLQKPIKMIGEHIIFVNVYMDFKSSFKVKVVNRTESIDDENSDDVIVDSSSSKENIDLRKENSSTKDATLEE